MKKRADHPEYPGRLKELVEPLNLKDQSNSLEQEARMVLPGIQALFGFQLIAVFSQNFKSDFTLHEQQLHYLALASTALSALWVLTPAAYHRQALPDCITAEFLKLAGRFLLGGMAFLAVAICLDFFLIGKAVGLDPVLNSITSTGLALAYIGAWFVYPRVKARSRDP